MIFSMQRISNKKTLVFKKMNFYQKKILKKKSLEIKERNI